MVKAVVFDVGETLINEGRLWRLWAEWLMVPDHVLFAVLGAMIERGEHHRRVFEIMRPEFNLEIARDERKNAGAPDECEERDIYPDVAGCWRALRERGVRIGVAGNQPDGIEQALEDAGLRADFVGSAARWGGEKPAPVFFQKMIETVNVAPAAIAYVGDRLDHDVLPARKAGMKAVFLRRGPWGYLHAQRPEARKAHARIDGLGELAGALERLGK
jgi:HAD superfamily hydrolase (TIGR01549 family)